MGTLYITKDVTGDILDVSYMVYTAKNLYDRYIEDLEKILIKKYKDIRILKRKGVKRIYEIDGIKRKYVAMIQVVQGSIIDCYHKRDLHNACICAINYTFESHNNGTVYAIYRKCDEDNLQSFVDCSCKNVLRKLDYNGTYKKMSESLYIDLTTKKYMNIRYDIITNIRLYC